MERLRDKPSTRWPDVTECPAIVARGHERWFFGIDCRGGFDDHIWHPTLWPSYRHSNNLARGHVLVTGWMMCSYLVSISLIIQSWFCSCSAAHYDCHAALEEQVKGAAQLGCEEPVANRWTLYPHIGCRRKSLGYFGVKYKDSLSIYICIYNRRKFRSQTSDNMDRWKAEQGRGREKRNIRREKSRRERVRRKKIQMREKVGKSRFTVFLQWFVAPEGRKVGSLKRRVRSQLARWEMKNCTPLWRDAHFQVKMYKTHQLRTTFGSCDVEKVHAVGARSTFPSQNVQSTPASDHFWKLRCRKSARRCGAKHILKSKCTKHTRFGPLLEVAMSKKCTPLWREAHFQVKMYKTHQLRTTFGSWDVEKVHAVVARSTFRSENVQNTTCSRHFWRFRCRKSARRCGAKHIARRCGAKHIWKSKC